jgi:hypothetical protein
VFTNTRSFARGLHKIMDARMRSSPQKLRYMHQNPVKRGLVANPRVAQ